MNSKKILAIFMASVVVLGNFPRTGQAQEDSGSTNQTVLNDSQLVNAMAIQPGTWVKAGFGVLKYATNTWLFHREATETIYDHVITISSGTVGFNNKNNSGYGSSARHRVYINGINQLIDTWPETSVLNWLDKISVLITDESNNTDVVSKTATHEQHTYYTAPHHGNYMIRWIDDAKMNWDLWLSVWDAEYGGIGSRSIAEDTNKVYTFKNADGIENQAKKIEGNYYFIPSNDHKKSDKFDGEKVLSIIDLQDQLYDNKLNREVQQFKNYDSGSNLVVADTIQTLVYDKENDRTVFGFKAKNGEILEWAFSGDLTENYSTGDVLKLNFKVVNKAGEFETLDYLLEARTNDAAPNLSDYLIQ